MEKAKIIHNNKYDYSKVEYNNYNTNVIIICPIHGEFEQIPSDHLNGKGCPYCKTSKLELSIIEFLSKYFPIIKQKKFKWLKNQSIDIFIQNHNIAIECQGEQHFKPIDFANKGTEWAQQNLERIQMLDRKKKMLCDENNIILLYFGKEKYNDDIIIDKTELLHKINDLICQKN